MNGKTQPYVAEELGLEAEEFKRKLREREKFNQEQIRSLVYLLGAEEAFSVIYFPSKRRRRKVWSEVFGEYKEREKLDERKQIRKP